MAKKLSETAAFKTQLGGIGSTGGGGDTTTGESPLADFLQAKAEELVRELTKNLKPSQATNNLAQSVEPRITVQGLGYRFQLFMDSYWRWVNDGRKPGKRPPIAPIEKWVTAKGIDVGPGDKMKNRRGMAYGIATNIGKNGTKGTKFFSKVVNKQWEEDFIRDLQKAWKQQVLIEISSALK